MNGTRTKVTREVYNHCKILADGGAKDQTISSMLNIGLSTVGFIRRAGTYEEYKAGSRAAFNRWVHTGGKQAQKDKPEAVSAKEEKAATVRPEAFGMSKSEERYQCNRMLEEMRKTNEYLKLISNKLAFIVEELS